MHLAVLIERQETALRSLDSNRLLAFVLKDDVSNLLLRAGLLRHGVFTADQTHHHALRDALKSTLGEQIKADRKAHAARALN